MNSSVDWAAPEHQPPRIVGPGGRLQGPHLSRRWPACAQLCLCFDGLMADSLRRRAA
ncbi:hypothetical protein [Mycetohabitans endofungorum]|uniref:hypothetical protein n=1 Tax=Mycetohabitans endofungorum TaxID=417203 RepID=UPI002B05C88D|nr:hypothetical protein [Mycetohabitans endofungorum]